MKGVAVGHVVERADIADIERAVRDRRAALDIQPGRAWRTAGTSVDMHGAAGILNADAVEGCTGGSFDREAARIGERAPADGRRVIELEGPAAVDRQARIGEPGGLIDGERTAGEYLQRSEEHTS